MGLDDRSAALSRATAAVPSQQLTHFREKNGVEMDMLPLGTITPPLAANTGPL